MSLKFGSGNKPSSGIQIVRQVPAKKARFEPISAEDRVLTVLKDSLINPHDFVSARKLLSQYEALISIFPMIEVDKRIHNLLIAKRLELCSIMIDPNPIIMADIYAPDRNDEKNLILFRMDILTFELVLALTCLCDNGKHAELSPIHFNALIKAGLIGEDYAYTPFRTMTLQEIFDCFTILQQNWKTIEYNNDLPLYLDAILMRISHFVCSEQNPSVFANCAAYVDSEDGQYYPNRNFIFDIGWTFIEMYMTLSVHTFFSDNCKPPPFEFTKADRTWIHSQARMIEQSENYQTKVMEIVLKHNCFPGEFERFIYEHKSERFARTPRFKKIIGARGIEGKAHARRLMEILNSKQPTELLGKDSGFNKACRDEILLLCLVHWIQRYVEIDFGATFVRSSTHCRLNYDSLDQLTKAQGYPVIIQTFNRYNVYYQNTLYMTNGIAKAFLLFLAFVMRFHKGKILNSPINRINLRSRDMHSYWEF